jgi:hypothetical protein
MTGGLFARIREACARVAAEARQVRICDAALAKLADELASAAPPPIADPVHAPFAEPATTLAFVVTLDAVNFGSGWFPKLVKRPGRSGYFAIALGLRERFEARGPWSAAELVRLTPEECSEVFGQREAGPEVQDLMALYARSLRDLGEWLAAQHAGSFERAVRSAAGSAERLVESLTEMPLYRDVARYEGFEVPFYKRAQITAADLATAFAGEGPGRFDDLDRLTLFADNLVPHVLRRVGVLVYAQELAARIGAEELLEVGAPEEVEIRALGLHAVERCVALCRERGFATSARQLDTLLWQRGQRPEIKAHPRHRSRNTCY